MNVSVANVTSFLYDRDVELEVPEVGRITLGVAFGGNFFAMVRCGLPGGSRFIRLMSPN